MTGYKRKSYISSAAAAAAKSLQLCPTVQTHRRQPIRLHHPWDSPGKNTGVGCHFQCMKVKSESEAAQSCLTLRDPMERNPPGSSIHGISQARVLEWGAIAFSNISSAIGCILRKWSWQYFLSHLLIYNVTLWKWSLCPLPLNLVGLVSYNQTNVVEVTPHDFQD